MLVKAFGPAKYSIYADFYSAAGIISVLLTHGMETTFFRFFKNLKIMLLVRIQYTTLHLLLFL